MVVILPGLPESVDPCLRVESREGRERSLYSNHTKVRRSEATCDLRSYPHSAEIFRISLVLYNNEPDSQHHLLRIASTLSRFLGLSSESLLMKNCTTHTMLIDKIVAF